MKKCFIEDQLHIWFRLNTKHGVIHIEDCRELTVCRVYEGLLEFLKCFPFFLLAALGKSGLCHAANIHI